MCGNEFHYLTCFMAYLTEGVEKANKDFSFYKQTHLLLEYSSIIYGKKKIFYKIIPVFGPYFK